MTAIQGSLAIAVGNVALLVALGRWNGDLHWAVGSVPMLFLVLAWVLYWAEDVETCECP